MLMTKKEKILLITILLFVGTLFFPNFPIITAISSVSFVFTCIFYNSWKEKIQLLKERKYIWWMLAFFILILLSILISDNKRAGFRYLDPRLPLLGFPLVLGLVYIRQQVKERILLAIAIFITIACSICLLYSLYYFIGSNNPSLLYNDSFTALTGQQSIYISLLVNISIYIFSFFLFARKPGSAKSQALLLVAIIYLFGVSYLLASRNMMLVLYLSTFLFCAWYIFKKKKYVPGFILLVGLSAVILLAFIFFPKTINRFKELAYTQFNYQHIGPESHYNDTVQPGQWNGANFRLAAWKCGWELFKRQPLIGVGLGDKKSRLSEIYQEKKFHFAIQSNKNVHSTYLDILFSMGITGFFFFIVAWIILPLVNNAVKKDWLSFIIISCLAIAMVTEVYLDRSLGGMLLGFFVVILSVDKRKEGIVAQ